MANVGRAAGRAAAAGGISAVAHTPTMEERARLAAPYMRHRCSVCGRVKPASHWSEAYEIREAHYRRIRKAGEGW